MGEKAVGSFFWHWKISCAIDILFKDILYNMDVVKKNAFIVVLLFSLLFNFGKMWKNRDLVKFWRLMEDSG